MNKLKIKENVVHAFNVKHNPFAASEVIELTTTDSQVSMWEKAENNTNNSCAHNEAFLIHLKGSIDKIALKNALEALPNLHSVLRGHFQSNGNSFLINSEMSFAVTHHNLLNSTPNEKQLQLETLALEYAQEPYNLNSGPLFKASIIELENQHCAVLLGSHHAICDGWSLDVLLDDLAKIYTAMTTATPFPNPARPTAVDFISFCTTEHYKRQKEKSIQYWKKVYSRPLNETNALKSNHQPQAAQAFKINNSHYVVSSASFNIVEKFSKQHGLSLFTIQFSAFVTFLYHSFDATDLVICIPVARHPDANMENSVGNFVNIIPVRCEFDENITFLALCRKVHNLLLDAREHSAVGIEEILKKLNFIDNKKRTPFSAARFIPIHKYSKEELQFGAADVSYDTIPHEFGTYDISISTMQEKDFFEMKISANSDGYSSRQLNSQLREMETLLINGCNNFDIKMSALEGREISQSRKTPLLPVDNNRPRRDLEAKLVELFSTELSIPTIGIYENFFLAGGNDHLAASLIENINNILKIELNVKSLHAHPSVALLSEAAEKEGANLNSVVVSLNKTKQKSPLFFVYGLAIYSPLAKNLNGIYTCYGIYVAEEEAFIDNHNKDSGISITELAALYVKAIRKHTPTGPYTIAGLSFGGILAFEVARQLKEANQKVLGLIILDSVLPGAKQRDWPLRIKLILERFKKGGFKYVFERLGQIANRYQLKSDRENKNTQLWQVVQGGATKHYFQSNPTYDDPTLIIRASNRVDIAGYRFAYDLCWSPKLKGPVILADAPGSHLGLLHSKETANLIRNYIHPLQSIDLK